MIVKPVHEDWGLHWRSRKEGSREQVLVCARVGMVRTLVMHKRGGGGKECIARSEGLSSSQSRASPRPRGWCLTGVDIYIYIYIYICIYNAYIDHEAGASRECDGARVTQAVGSVPS